MFDIGFSEIMVIGVVALVVIGPEKLPKMARTMGHLTGRMQRYVNEVKADINREMEMADLKKFRDDIEAGASACEGSIRSELAKTEAELNATAQNLVDPHGIGMAGSDPLSLLAGGESGSTRAAPAPDTRVHY